MQWISRRRFLRDAVAMAPALALAPGAQAASAWLAQGSAMPDATRDETRDAMRIATPDRAGAESVLALGIKPVGAPSADFYREMGGTPDLPAGIPSVGPPVEPNLEVLKSLAPAMIVTGTIAQSTRRMLARVAPVLNLDIYTGEPGAYGRAVAEFRRLADVVGRSAVAQSYVSRLEADIARAATALRARGDRPAYLVTLDDGGRTMTVYGRNSIMYDVMEMMGVPNAWDGRTNGFGFMPVGVEKLVAHPDADLIYVNYGLDTTAALGRLRASPFWNSLPMVRAGRVHPIPLFDVFGSLPLAGPFAANLAAALSNGEGRHG